MKTMLAVVYDQPGAFEVRQVPVPQPGPGEVLLRMVVVGVCGTDVHLHHGEFGPAYPLTPGHEIVGEVTALGSGVSGMRVGERVTVDRGSTLQAGSRSSWSPTPTAVSTSTT